MCEIHLIKRFNDNTLNFKDREVFLNLMLKGSLTNKDAFGLFSENYFLRLPIAFYEIEEEIYKNLFENLKGSFIIGHNRFKTNGDAKDNLNNHTFKSKNFILVHNGIISNYKALKKLMGFEYAKETDTTIIIKLLEHYYKDSSNTIEAIKKTAEMLKGSYSVLLYDRNTKEIFYFKNSSTSFYFCLITNKEREYILIGSTNAENLKDIYTSDLMIFKKEDFKEKLIIKAKSETIYLIDNSQIKEVATFKENTINDFLGGYEFNKKDKKKHNEKTKELIGDFITEVKGVIHNDFKYYIKKNTIYLKIFNSENREYLRELYENLIYEVALNKPLEVDISDLKQYFY